MIELDLLIQRCKANDVLAWEALVKSFQQRVYSMALYMLRDKHEAQDATQETFIKVYRELKRFDGDGTSFPAWALTITRNNCLDRIRQRKTAIESNRDHDTDMEEVLDDSPFPERVYRLNEWGQLIYRALQRMSPEYKELIILKEIQGLQINEIAAMLATSEGTVKSRSNRAKLQLAKVIRELNPDFSVDGSSE